MLLQAEVVLPVAGACVYYQSLLLHAEVVLPVAGACVCYQSLLQHAEVVLPVAGACVCYQSLLLQAAPPTVFTSPCYYRLLLPQYFLYRSNPPYSQVTLKFIHKMFKNVHVFDE